MEQTTLQTISTLTHPLPQAILIWKEYKLGPVLPDSQGIPYFYLSNSNNQDTMVLPTTNRRGFLKTGFLGLGSVLMLPSCLKHYAPWQFFTEDEAVCMASICEQIIPADEHGPGATYAGVIFYIDKQLNEIFTRDQKDYREGIAAIQNSALSIYGKRFESLEFDVQTNFLRQMEADAVQGESWKEIIGQSSLLRKMIDHSMQGFYGSPRHGGNRNYISYKIMKLDYPYIVGQNRYKDTRSN